MNPLFSEDRDGKERKVIIEEIRSYDDIAEERRRSFNEIHFKGSGIARPIAGTAKSVRALTRAQMPATSIRCFTTFPYMSARRAG